MEFLSSIITTILDLLVAPFGAERHTLGLVWLSLLSGAGMALVFKATINTRSILAAKARFRSYIYEMRIYQDSIRAVFIAFIHSLWSNVIYVRSILPPVLVLVIPTILLLAQLDERYGASHLPVDGTTVLTVRLVGGVDPHEEDAALTCGPGATVDAGPVRIPGTNEISWRVRIDVPGAHEATLSIGGVEYPVRLVAMPAYRMIGRMRGSKSLEPLLHPGMLPIPEKSRIEHVHVNYPSASYPLLFWRVHWLVIFLFYAVVGAAVIKLLVGFDI